MRILFIGDIVGKSGRDIVSSLLYDLKKEYGADLVIANAENAAHGKGITYKIYKQLLNEGIDYITMGNHTFSKSEIYEHIDDMDRLVIPYNHS
ncbi:MAG: YmdB family metallophosphoesterase, partial [Erysipelotrichaceae bacterium]|nr:YmdB family metallophosphoesterase [Erysipelotrichaceae bacterium]